MARVTVSAFYKFAPVADCTSLRASLDATCRAHGILGTILIAPEGINGTVAGGASAIAALHRTIRATAQFADLVTKQSHTDAMPFGRLKVKEKPEIVTFGVPEADPNRRVGVYVSPAAWNTLISDPEVMLIDTRNSYEVAVGTFRGAINPGTRSFAEFPDFVKSSLDPGKHKKIAMFCTGGIRCEKATAFMLQQGFREVFHLEGGILKYLETVPRDESLWHGDCFVFDDRVAVTHGLEVVRHALCPRCGQPADTASGGASATACDLCRRSDAA